MRRVPGLWFGGGARRLVFVLPLPSSQAAAKEAADAEAALWTVSPSSAVPPNWSDFEAGDTSLPSAAA